MAVLGTVFRTPVPTIYGLSQPYIIYSYKFLILQEKTMH